MEKSNPSNGASRMDPALVRDIYRAYLDELAAITAYSYQRILTEQDLPAAAKLLADISMDEMHHFLELGRLLQRWGASPAVDLRLRDRPILLQNDRDSHVPVVTQRLLLSNAAAERASSANYRALAERTGDAAAREMLLSLSRDEQSHANAQEALAKRLTQS